MITCSKCGHQNALGHMFCMRCRARLDLQTHLDTKMLKGGVKTRGFGGGRLAILAVVLLAVAILGLALRPGSIKPVVSTSADFASVCRKIILLETVSGSQPQSFSEAEVNAYLDAVVARARKLDEKGFVASRIRTVRLVLEKDSLVVQVERTLGPFTLGPMNLGTIESSYELAGLPEAGEAGFSFSVKSGKRGMLPVPAALCRSATAELKGLFSKLKKEREFLDRIAAIDVDDGKLVISMKPLR